MNDNKDKLQGAEILFGFLGWLTSRYEVTTLSAQHGAGQAVDLMKRFCDTNELSHDCRPRWDDALTHPPVLPGEADGTSPDEQPPEKVKAEEDPSTGIFGAIERLLARDGVAVVRFVHGKCSITDAPIVSVCVEYLELPAAHRVVYMDSPYHKKLLVAAVTCLADSPVGEGGPNDQLALLHNTPPSHGDCSAAVTSLVEAWRVDEDFRYGWQANIAVHFQDCAPEAWARDKVHSVSNEAADRFLCSLERSPTGDSECVGGVHMTTGRRDVQGDPVLDEEDMWPDGPDDVAQSP